jgi:hypothetical protein
MMIRVNFIFICVYLLISSYASTAATPPCGLDLPPTSPLAGSISARPALFTGPSNFWSVGAETMDRGFTNYSSWRNFLGPLGVRTARLQAGWAKCEPTANGVYEFEWLDTIITDMLTQGVTPWLQLSFGNPSYVGGGKASVNSPLPNSTVALTAWDAWSKAVVERYSVSGILTFEVWNEPNIQHIDAGAYGEFVVRTARVIKSIAPTASVRFGVLAGSSDTTYARTLANYIVAANASAFVDTLTYHPYDYNPDTSYGGVAAFRTVLDDAGLTKVTLAQGENGAPSVGGGYGALTGYNWTDFSQAKYFSRRFLRDGASNIPSSAFSIVDLCYMGAGEVIDVNHKGLLEANCDDAGVYPVTRVKLAYTAVAHVAAIFDDTAVPMAEKPMATFYCPQKTFNVFVGGWFKNSTLPIFALWNSSGTPLNADMASTLLCDVNITAVGMVTGVDFNTFVGVDMLSGSVFRVIASPNGVSSIMFKSVPISDSPLLLAPASAITFVPLPPSTPNTLPPPADIVATVQPLVESFQAAHYDAGNSHWERAAYFFGHTAVRTSLPLQSAAIHDAYAVSWASGNEWSCNGSSWPGDTGMAWTVDALVQRGLAPAAARTPMANVMAQIAATTGPSSRYLWWWVDTLIYNIPEWLVFGTALNKPEWIAFAASQWNDTKTGVSGNASAPGLWSPIHGLWYRDAAHMNTTSSSGGPVFWGRGNAWAAIAITRTLDYSILLPGDPWRADLEDTLEKMAAAYARTQHSKNGLWGASLLDAASFPYGETTASAGAIALLAYGVRANLLDRAIYMPIIASAWSAFVTTGLSRDGAAVQFCQPVGAAPAAATQNDTSDFCAGLFLLAAEQVYRLAAM